MRKRSLTVVTLTATTMMTMIAQMGAPAFAQPAPRHRPASGQIQRVATTPTTTYRGLTINRQPQAPSGSLDDDRDIYEDGPIRYNDIRDFSPAPYTTSGVQFPYGLDGIGGFGSDLGFASGQDSVLYNRGAGSLR